MKRHIPLSFLILTFLGLFFLSIFGASIVFAEAVVWNFNNADNRLKLTGSDVSGTAWSQLTDGKEAASANKNAADYISYVFDPVLGSSVVQFSENNKDAVGAAIQLGEFPGIAKNSSSIADNFPVSDFTISFWAKTSNTAGNRTMIGWRYFQGDHNFMKVDGGSLQYYTTLNGGNLLGIGLMSGGDQWHYYSITKSNETLTTYRDGAKVGNGSTTGNMQSAKFGIGGDPYNTNELWNGSLDDITISSTALTEEQIKSEYVSLVNAVKPGAGLNDISHTTTILDDFNIANQTIVQSASIAADSKWKGSGIEWKTINKGLESTGASDISASVKDGQLVISGTATGGAPWRGITLQTQETYTASKDNIVIFSVDKVSLEKAGDHARASIWMFSENNKYVQFGQNTEAENKYTYNNCNTGGGDPTSIVTPLNEVNTMTLKHDGSNVWMYVDGQLAGITAVNFDTFSLMVTGMSRSYNSGNNTVKAVFDNASLSVIESSKWQTPSIEITDSFDSAASESDWKLTDASVDNTFGFLKMANSGQATYKTPYSFVNDFDIRVVRETMNPGVTTGGLQVDSDSGDQLRVYQCGNGNWVLDWDGLDVTNLQYLPEGEEPIELTIENNNALLYSGDLFTSQILLDSTAIDLGESIFDLYLNDRHFQFSASGLEGIFQASLFGTGNNGNLYFNNFGIRAQDVPEPSTWALLILGALGLVSWRYHDRRSNGIVRLK